MPEQVTDLLFNDFVEWVFTAWFFANGLGYVWRHYRGLPCYNPAPERTTFAFIMFAAAFYYLELALDVFEHDTSRFVQRSIILFWLAATSMTHIYRIWITRHVRMASE